MIDYRYKKIPLEAVHCGIDTTSSLLCNSFHKDSALVPKIAYNQWFLPTINKTLALLAFTWSWYAAKNIYIPRHCMSHSTYVSLSVPFCNHVAFQRSLWAAHKKSLFYSFTLWVYIETSKSGLLISLWMKQIKCYYCYNIFLYHLYFW